MSTVPWLLSEKFAATKPMSTADEVHYWDSIPTATYLALAIQLGQGKSWVERTQLADIVRDIRYITNPDRTRIRPHIDLRCPDLNQIVKAAFSEEPEHPAHTQALNVITTWRNKDAENESEKNIQAILAQTHVNINPRSLEKQLLILSSPERLRMVNEHGLTQAGGRYGQTGDRQSLNLTLLSSELLERGRYVATRLLFKDDHDRLFSWEASGDEIPDVKIGQAYGLSGVFKGHSAVNGLTVNQLIRCNHITTPDGEPVPKRAAAVQSTSTQPDAIISLPIPPFRYGEVIAAKDAQGTLLVFPEKAARLVKDFVIALPADEVIAAKSVGKRYPDAFPIDDSPLGIRKAQDTMARAVAGSVFEASYLPITHAIGGVYSKYAGQLSERQITNKVNKALEGQGVRIRLDVAGEDPMAAAASVIKQLEPVKLKAPNEDHGQRAQAHNNGMRHGWRSR
jgi:hypothetical protein